ncbi:MAG: NAD(P)-binding protein [Nitrospinaceae bacterium]|nr:NAD(P)-binding protein [Nitrospinaceae bacterium]MBT3432932.1 NAD(P)-binding protein [Nitrospinaceae bacterium]MBT4093841.1 NAD(P)-binding protein [Nitrospinaceae bacterium]MBT4430137.1 NAD(P)-binding protein [Nitrospinaceae bacterium]MBT5368549.1 NAD(P)-binding protein [Nitrospinaceae bacterium]
MSGEPGQEGTVVIGAGFAGASAALSLAEGGGRVCLFEAGRSPGGRARSFLDRRSGLDLDWGPHLFMKSNPALLCFLDRIGATPDLHFESSLDLVYRMVGDVAKRDVRLERLCFPEWGRSLGALWALMRWRGPSAKERVSILKGLFRLIRENSGASVESVETMLTRLGQGSAERKWFWEPFVRAVLNMPMSEGSGELFRRVVAESFSQGPSGATLGAPSIAMHPFWGARALNAIRNKGGEVRMSAPVSRIAVEGGSVNGVVLPGGEFISAARVISAVPPPALIAMLPPELLGQSPWRDLSRMQPGPIASAYIWLDSDEPGPRYEALLGEPWEWLFRPRGNGRGPGAPVALLTGGVDSIAAGPRGRLETTARETASRIFPGTAVRRVLIVRERAATWANGVDEQPFRPEAQTPVKGLILAGDWTATGFPATCEGAVRSGFKAAEVALALEGIEQIEQG